MRAYNPRSGLESLLVGPISQASALQRTGRAGRTKPGKCYRLYTKSAYSSLSPTSIPEIQRTDLAPVILALKSLGIDNVLRFEFLSPPSAESMIRALELLYSLGALDDYGRLTTPLGQRMAEIPLPPSMARMLLGSAKWGCTDEVLSIAAMCSVQGIFVQAEGDKQMEFQRRKFTVEEGDHLTLLNGKDLRRS
jgi:ATP-dependent RNA helicase DDX35